MGIIKKILFLLVSLLAGMGLLVWILRLVGWQQIKGAFRVFTGWQGLVILGITLLIILVGNWRWKEILKGEGVEVSFGELLRPYLAAFALMFLAPIMLWGGEVFRGYILKKKNSVPWAKGVASVVIDRVLEWTANLVIVFFGVFSFFLMTGVSPMSLGLVFGIAFLFFAVAIFFFYFKSYRRESIVRFITRSKQDQPLEIETEIFNFFGFKKKTMWKGFLISILKATAAYFRAWILIFFLGKNIGPLSALSILGFSYLAAMIPIPAAIGSHEAIQAFSFSALRLGVSAAPVFTMIIRGSELIVALIGLIALSRLGIELFKNAIFRQSYKQD